MSGEGATFDIVILGCQLGGLAAAQALVQAGRRVALVDLEGARLPLSLDASGGRWVGHRHLPLSKLHGAGGLATLLAPSQARPALPGRVAPVLQVVLGGRRLSLLPDAAGSASELARAFADGPAAERQLAGLRNDAAPIPALLDSPLGLSPANWWRRWQVNRASRAIPRLGELSSAASASGHPLLAAARGLAPLKLHVAAPSALATARAMALGIEAPTVSGGLAPAALTALEALGVALFKGPLESLSLEGTDGFRITLPSGPLRARKLLLATDLSRVTPKFGDRARAAPLEKLAGSIAPTGLLWDVLWALPSRAVPLPMVGPVLTEMADGQPCWLERITEAEGDGREQLWLSRHPVGLQVERDAAARKAATEAARAVLGEVAPFIEPLRHRELFSAEAPLAHPHFAPRLDVVHGLAGIPTELPVPGLLLASREVLPGLGAEGEIWAGLHAARLALAALAREDRKRPVPKQLPPPAARA